MLANPILCAYSGYTAQEDAMISVVAVLLK